MEIEEIKLDMAKRARLAILMKKSVYGSTCSELPAESTGISQRYVIHRSENMWFSWSDIDMPQSFCMQLSNDAN